MIFPVFISCLTIFGCLTIATFEPTRTTTIFDTKQPSLTEKSTENEGLSPVTTRWLREADLNHFLARLCRLTSCGAQNRLNASVDATDFDRGASLRSLHLALRAVATSPREPEGRFCKKEKTLLYSKVFLVAGGGFEPPTFGL